MYRLWLWEHLTMEILPNKSHTGSSFIQLSLVGYISLYINTG